MLSILTEIGQKPENIISLTVRISKCRKGIFRFLFRFFRIDGINAKKSESGSLRGQNLIIGSLGGYLEKL
jgi:hypothetical protein